MMEPIFYPVKTRLWCRCLFSFLYLLTSCCISTESRAFYWTWYDYNEKSNRYSRRSVDHHEDYNLVKYIDDLLSENSSDDSLENKIRRKETIAYLLATGGPNGFSQTSATKEEKEILLKACSFAALLHERLGCEGHLNLWDIRGGRSILTEIDKTHLLIAQTAITATRVLVKSAQHLPLKDFVESVRDLYYSEYHPVAREIFSDRTQQFIAFIQAFTKEFAERTRTAFEECLGPISDAHPNSVPLVCYTEQVLQKYLESILRNASRVTDIQHRPSETEKSMKNGLVVTRKANGSMIFTSKRSLNLGKIPFTPSSIYRAPIIFHSGGVLLSKYQSDLDFWTTLEKSLGGFVSGDSGAHSNSLASYNASYNGRLLDVLGQ